MKKLALALAVLVVGVVWIAPDAVLACPVCQGGPGETRDNTTAFIATTVLLSILPLFAIGGLITWIAAQSRESRESDADLVRRTLAATDADVPVRPVGRNPLPAVPTR
jgi:hypothetical protein